jgi:3-oxoacyl-[acyl-carrier-protein] synthase II
MNREVLITGIGILSPIGIGKNTFWNGLIKGDIGFSTITLFETSSFKVHIGGEVDFDPIEFLGKKGLRSLDRSTRLINTAAKLAIDDSTIDISDDNTHAVGVCIGTTFGSLHSISQFDREGLIEGPRYVNPSHFPNTVINSPASQVSIRFKIKGFNTTISTGFCASLDALAYAADFIKLGRADAVLAGGVEEFCEETFLGFHNLGYLSGTDGSEPVCCPYDARRNGIILSEGAAILILEEKRFALNRGARILARFKGYGNSFDPSAGKNFRQDGTGLKNAILGTLKDAHLSPEQTDYICGSANSTRELDRMETAVIKEVFGYHASKIPVSSVKSMLGESFSASGALSLTAAVGALNRGFIPPTMNYEERDPECDLDYVPNESRQSRLRNILIISSDPYGNNSAVILGKYEG